MLRAVIFDMDGVLIDTVGAAYRVKSEILRDQYDIDLATVHDPHLERHKGSSIESLLRTVRIYSGKAIDEVTFTNKVVAGITKDLRARGVTADQRLIKLMDGLRQNGVRLAIGTTATKLSADNKLAILGICSYFELVLTAEDVKRHKPDPAIYVKAMKLLGVKQDETVIVEDSRAGIEAGILAGATVVGFTGFTVNKGPLRDTALTIDSWNQINFEKLSLLVG